MNPETLSPPAPLWTAPTGFDRVNPMPTPLALCLEDLAPSSRSERFLRCVALAGRKPGLRLGPDGVVAWRSEAPVACELWVSLDERLILLRPAGAPPIVVRRAGRVLDVPFDKPVVVTDQDVVEVGPKRLRLHLHGQALEVTAPMFLPERSMAGATRLAAVVAMGAAVVGCKGTGGEVRGGASATTTGPATTAPATGATTATAPIEVRESPPAPPEYTPPPQGQPSGPTR